MTTDPAVHGLRDVPRRADGRVDLDGVVRALRPLGPTHVLESAPDVPGARPWSYVVPAATATLVADGEAARVLGADGIELSQDPLTALRQLSERLGLVPDVSLTPGLPPFTGGLVGVLSYDLARHIEALPAHARSDRADPLILMSLADVVVAIHDEQALLIRRPLLGPARGASRFVEALARAGGDDREPAPAAISSVTTSLSPGAYEDAVRDALEHIAAGDVYQVNLTQRLTAAWPGDVHSLYRALRARTPAPHGAVIDSQEHGAAAASVSPETFLRCDGRRVVTRPVKGTRPRGSSPGEDRRQGAELADSAKDRAENVMIVDLERNDLGRVCAPGSVEVVELLTAEAHPTVWHLVSTVHGELRHDVGWAELLRAVTPCGSVTGAPKVRAMQIIDRLEPVRRGWYCGAIGYIGAGSLDLSVAIRTAVLHADGTADYGAGGGIVADSRPADEVAESFVKARAFLDAVGHGVGTDPPTDDREG